MRFKVQLYLVLLGFVAAASAEATKIGFVEVERAVTTIEQGQAALKALDSWAEPRRQVLTALGLEQAHIQSQIQEKTGTGSREEIEQLQEQLLAKGREIEDKQRSFSRAYEVKKAELLSDIANRLNDLIIEYAEEHDFEAVFVMKDQMLLYIAGSAQLTDVVIRLYNERYPVQTR